MIKSQLAHPNTLNSKKKKKNPKSNQFSAVEIHKF